MEVQQMIQDRLRKVEEIKHSVELNKVSTRTLTPQPHLLTQCCNHAYHHPDPVL